MASPARLVLALLLGLDFAASGCWFDPTDPMYYNGSARLRHLPAWFGQDDSDALAATSCGAQVETRS